MNKKVIAVDLDGTLAEYHGWVGDSHIGKPISKMVDRVHRWLEEGHTVVLFTARLSENTIAASEHITKWLRENEIPITEMTCSKQKRLCGLSD